MSHLDENVIASLFERRASAMVIAEIDVHVASCQACRDLLATYAELFEGGGTLGPTVATPPPQAAGTQLLEGDGPPPLTPSILAWIDRHGPNQRIGKVLRDKWTLDSLLGSGGMGHVYAATHRNGRRGAVKVLRPELAANPEVVERFLREGYVANRIGHPGTVTILDDDTSEDGAPFLVMELLEGESFGDRLQREGRIGVKEVLGVAEQVLDVLAAAHPQGIVHRDLKPDNLFVTREGKVKVLDFGIARILELPKGSVGTQTGAAMGTPQFMPPEQARGEWNAVDGRTDLWALGATMYTCITGVPVRDAETPNLALLLAMTEPVRKVREVAPWVPIATAQVIDRALSMDRDERFATAQDMQRAIRHAALTAGAVVTEMMSAPSPVSPEMLSRRVGFERPSSPRNRAWIAAVIGAVLLTLGVAIAFVSSSTSDRHRAAALVEPPATSSPAPSALLSPEPTSVASAALSAPAFPSVTAMSSSRPIVRAQPRGVATQKSAASHVAPAAAPPAPKPASEEGNPLDIRR